MLDVGLADRAAERIVRSLVGVAYEKLLGFRGCMDPGLRVPKPLAMGALAPPSGEALYFSLRGPEFAYSFVPLAID